MTNIIKFQLIRMKNIIVAVLAIMLASAGYAADLPDSALTPGYANPAVTQANVQTTICIPGWTKTIRPPASYTTKLKLKQLRGDGPYKSALGAAVFEEDHLISLEIGGHPTDSRNLWPETWSHPNGAHEKDQLENKLKRMVCAGTLTLDAAQQAIANDWIAAYRKYVLIK